jgi:hypothetical protein
VALAVIQATQLMPLGLPAPVIHFILARTVVRWAAGGVLGGLFFALALRRAGRGVATVQELSVWRAGVCGAAAGLGVPLGVMASVHPTDRPFERVAGILMYLAVGAVIGAVAAASMMALARQAPQEPLSADSERSAGLHAAERMVAADGAVHRSVNAKAPTLPPRS